MTGEPETSAVLEQEEEPEITAKIERRDLVRGWLEREQKVPRVVPVVKFAARTDIGRARENNEDKFDFYEPEEPSILAARGSFYAVADGMGGHVAGQIASEMALKQVLTAYYNSATEDVAVAILEAIQEANKCVLDYARSRNIRGGMGTTLTALVLVEDRAYVAQVGDSRAYLLRGGEIRQVTLDHSWVAEQVRLGGIPPEEAENHPWRNIITRSIGNQETVDPDVFVDKSEPGDIWVLCSDGLTGHVQPEEIEQIAVAHAPSEACRQLVELACARGGRDNITVLVAAVRDIVPGGAS